MFMFVKRNIVKRDSNQLSLVLFVVYSDKKNTFLIGLVIPGVWLQSLFHGFDVAQTEIIVGIRRVFRQKN